MLPHDGAEGVHGVWFMEDAEAARPSWRRVHEAVLEDLSVYYFLTMMCDIEKPVDFPGGSGDFIMLNQDGEQLMRYDLESGRKVELLSLYGDTNRLHALYHRFHAFPFFG
jgi:hypothetical protein